MGLIEKINDKKTVTFFKKKCIFLQDSAPDHKSIKSMEKINELLFELLAYPPHSPNLTPGTFFCSYT